MVEEQGYQIVITSSAERAYFEILDYIFEYQSINRANEIAVELLDYPKILKKFPNLGKMEFNLEHRAENYRFIIYERTDEAAVKIIYYVDEYSKTIYLTDFFPCEMSDQNIERRR